MPSGVCHGAAWAGAAAGVSVKATCEKSGMRLMRSPVLRQNIVTGGQCRQHVAALVNESLHARRSQRGLSLERPPGEVNVSRPGCLEPRHGCACVLLVDLVRRAQANQWRACVLEGCGKR